jgi:hypothetical protein
MSNIKKLMMSAAGGGGLDVDEVFSTYVYTGTSVAQTITNGIDLSGEGGLVWTKNRSNLTQHALCSAETGFNKDLSTASDGPINNETTAIDQFNTDGYSISGNATNYNNSSLGNYASWTFRKAPKFFDIVTYTGNGTAGRTVSHSLGATPGAILIKCTSAAENWRMWHTSLATNESIMVNSTGPKTNTVNFLNNTSPTSTTVTLGNHKDCNANGDTYVMYLFAHNNGDGEFGPDGDQDIIKCGGWSSTGTTTIDLGFEPQWILIKATTNNSNWAIYDVMRGQVVGGTAQELYPNLTNAEGSGSLFATVSPTPTGFSVTSGNTADHIYMAIRRGSLFPPESGTDVFAVANHGTSNPAWVSGFPTDMAYGIGSSAPYLSDRLRGPKLSAMFSGNTDASNNNVTWDWQNGYHEGTSYSPKKAHMWKRAPGFFDVVAYTGNGTAGRTVSHNLGVAPEMIWAKGRDIAQNWAVYNPNGRLQLLNQSGAEYSAAVTDDYYGNGSSVIAPTATEFTIGSASPINNSNNKYMAYLFATLAGISKVGSYTGNGSSQTINCGFTSGAKMVLTKRTDSTGNWNVWDSERGIVAGNDPRIALNDQYGTIDTGHDYIDPHNSGFIVNYVANDADDSNVNGASYIFYAIA